MTSRCTSYNYLRKSAFGLIFLLITLWNYGRDVLVLRPDDQNVSQKIKDFLKADSHNKTIHFENGNYYFQEPIDLISNVTITGASKEGTTLIFDLGGQGNCINAIGSSEKAIYNVSLHHGEAPEIYGFFKVFNADPSEVGLSKWGGESFGKIITGELDGDRLLMTQRLSEIEKDILGDSILAYRILPIRNVSISKLTIIRMDESEMQTSNVFFKYATDCIVSDVISLNCNYGHITLESSCRTRLNHCIFKNAFSHGNGGKGYGVALQYGSTLNEVSGCAFDSLRHGIVLQLGANHNKITGNFFEEGFWEEVWLPARAAGDIVLHGNYPFMNTISFNVCNNIVIDNSHGKNGPENKIEKNQINLYGVYFNRKAVDGSTDVSENHLTRGGIFKGKIHCAGNKVVLVCNKRKNKILNKKSCDLLNLDSTSDEPIENDLKFPEGQFKNDAMKYFSIER